MTLDSKIQKFIKFAIPKISGDFKSRDQECNLNCENREISEKYWDKEVV